jgi:DNA-binding transcriptional LysR family regulator
VHYRLALQLQRMLPISLLEPPFPMPEMQQSMQWHKYRSHDPALVWLRNLLHDAARAMDAPQP